LFSPACVSTSQLQCAVQQLCTVLPIAPWVQEKEDWINAVGRAIVRHSKRWAGAALAPVVEG